MPSAFVLGTVASSVRHRGANSVRTPFTALDEQTTDNRRLLLQHLEVTAQGVQTVDGERDLEGLMRFLTR